MLKDITIGQYFPGKSIIHRLDAGFKIIITMIFIIMLFMADSAVSMAVCIFFMIISYLLTLLKPKLIIKSLKPVVPILIITAILNIFFYEGETLVSFGFIEITDEGLKNAVFMLVRVIALIIGSSILTYTTSPIDLTRAIERLLTPLKKFKVPVHEMAMMMTIALRFIPTLIEETDRIISAQKARGADFETGSLKKRATAIAPVIVPLFLSAFRRAEELALAMECRCYRGGEGRTCMRVTHIKVADFFALIISLLFLFVIIYFDYILK